MLPAVKLNFLAQTRAQLFGAFRRVRQSFEQCAEIQSRACRQNGQFSALTHFGENLHSLAAILTCGENLLGLDEVDQVVRHSTLFGQRHLRSADIEMLVDLGGIANEHFAVQPLGEPNRQRRFAGSGGPEDDDKWGGRSHLEKFQIRPSKTTAAKISVPEICAQLGFTERLLSGTWLDIVVKRGTQFDEGALEL